MLIIRTSQISQMKSGGPSSIFSSKCAGVNDATAVVVGKYAIVGIDVKAKLDRTRVESIKYSVAESLKNDPDANAVVVADVDTYERLKQIGKQIKKEKQAKVYWMS